MSYEAKLNSPTTCSNFTWVQCIFANELPKQFGRFNAMWTLCQGVAIWKMWLEWNDQVFNKVDWPLEKITTRMWQGFTDYGKIAWNQCLNILIEASDGWYKNFDSWWRNNSIEYSRQGWKLRLLPSRNQNSLRIVLWQWGCTIIFFGSQKCHGVVGIFKSWLDQHLLWYP